MSRVAAVGVASVASLVLAGAAVAGAGNARPSSGQCAGAWNRHAPPTIHELVVTGRVWQATVDVTTLISFRDSWSRSGAKSQRQTAGQGCVFVFFLSGSSVTISAVWRKGSIARWLPLSRHAGPVESGNACVSLDGTIHHVGAFTAQSRCRRG